MKLNLGAGNRPAKGFVNHDWARHAPHIDVAHNLDTLPWPWKDGSAEVIRAWAVFEHLELTLAESIEECWRVMKVGGTLVVKVPRFGAETVCHDPTHRWMGWERETFRFFDPDKGGKYGQRGRMYGLCPWKLVEAKYAVQGKAVVATLVKREKK